MNDGGGGGLKDGGGGLMGAGLRNTVLLGFVSEYLLALSTYDCVAFFTSISVFVLGISGVGRLSFFFVGIFISKCVVGILLIL